MSGTSKLDLINCVICDDVRNEISNKETIVGVYNSGITVPSLPWTMSICLWFQVMWSGEGEMQLDIAVLNPRQHEVGKIDGKAHAILQGHLSTLVFRGLFITFGMEGTYNIKWRGDYRDWQLVRDFTVHVERDPPIAS